MNNSESQDEYGTFDLDLEDPDVLAALGGPVEPSPIEIKENATREVRGSSTYLLLLILICCDRSLLQASRLLFITSFPSTPPRQTMIRCRGKAGMT